jgi:HSP20 family protein
MGEFFADLPQDWPQRPIGTSPRVDITESDDAYRVRAELPGVSKEDVTVELEQGVLCIRGEKKTRRDEKTERGRRLECSYGAFSRSLTLPQDADADRISAEFRDGVLEVAIAKTPESKPKQISVKG